MKKSLITKLSMYTLSATAGLVTAITSQATVIYTDVNPDSTLNGGDVYALDLNNDGTPDFNLNMISSSYSGSYFKSDRKGVRVDMIGYGGNNAIARQNGGGYSYFAEALNYGAAISNSLLWNNYGLEMAQSNFSSWSSNPYSNITGPWIGVADKFLGLRFDIGGNPHYGWARLDVDAIPNRAVLKDYAYEDFSGTLINAGDEGGPAVDSTNTLVIADIAENYDTDDLYLSFNMATDESNISEYRVFLVPIANVSTFGYHKVITSPSSDYYSVTPSGTNFSGTLNAGINDYNGDEVILDDLYQAFIVSVPTTGFSYNMSLGSNQVTISSPPPTPSAEGIVMTDISDNRNGSDVQVTFNKAIDETTIAYYKFLMVPKSAVQYVTVDNASNAPGSWSKSFNPTGSDFSTILDANTLDFQGNLIVENKPYIGYVVSINNNGINPNSISDGSNELILTSPDGILDLSSGSFDVNMTQGQLTIENKSQFKNIELNIYTLDGKSIINKKLRSMEESILVDSKGMFVVTITSKNEILYSEKIIVN